MELGGTGMTIAEHVFLRLNASKYIDKVVFAIPDTDTNDRLAEFLEQHQIEFVRGSEDNVLDRFYQCARIYQPEIVVRATCDNPCVDWIQIDGLIEHLPGNDYISSQGAPLGTSAEVFSAKALYEAHDKASADVEKEHVTPYIYKHKDIFKVSKVPYHLNVNKEMFRLTVDAPQDLEVANIIYKTLYDGEPIENESIYQYLLANADVRRINESVEQKGI